MLNSAMMAPTRRQWTAAFTRCWSVRNCWAMLTGWGWAAGGRERGRWGGTTGWEGRGRNWCRRGHRLVSAVIVRIQDRIVQVQDRISVMGAMHGSLNCRWLHDNAGVRWISSLDVIGRWKMTTASVYITQSYCDLCSWLSLRNKN